MKRAIAAKNYSKGGCERIGVHLDDGSTSQNTKSNSPFWQSLSVSGCIFYCRYTFFDTLTPGSGRVLFYACFSRAVRSPIFSSSARHRLDSSFFHTRK